MACCVGALCSAAAVRSGRPRLPRASQACSKADPERGDQVRLSFDLASKAAMRALAVAVWLHTSRRRTVPRASSRLRADDSDAQRDRIATVPQPGNIHVTVVRRDSQTMRRSGPAGRAAAGDQGGRCPAALLNSGAHSRSWPEPGVQDWQASLRSPSWRPRYCAPTAGLAVVCPSLFDQAA